MHSPVPFLSLQNMTTAENLTTTGITHQWLKVTEENVKQFYVVVSVFLVK